MQDSLDSEDNNKIAVVSLLQRAKPRFSPDPCLCPLGEAQIYNINGSETMVIEPKL